MLDVREILTNLDSVRESMRKRAGEKYLPFLDELEKVDQERKRAIQTVEALKAQRNEASLKIAELKKQKQDDTALLQQMKQVSSEVKRLDESLGVIQSRLHELLLELPNVLHPSVPAGKDFEQNVEIKSWGKKPTFSFTPKSHDEIGEKLGIIDFKKAGEVTGTRFVFLKGLGARLERALIQFMLDEHGKKGYQEILPPFLVNRSSLTGTGQLPKFEEDVFRIEKYDYFLIPTAEVPVTNYHRDEIVDEAALPLKYVAYTPCFRSEAGSYGKDTKGLKRQHQFNKVELVQLVRPEESEKALEGLLADAESILQKLGLSYRVMLLCGGDTGFGSHKTYDIEVWSPAINGYMEISSCSTFGAYQARRAQIRYRSSADRKVHFLHTLNGSGLAVGRTLLALIENFQKEDGTFEIPSALKEYLS